MIGRCRRKTASGAFSRLGSVRLATPITMVIALLVASALALSACGGEDAQLLPAETAREIEANLTTVQRLAAEGDCVGAESAVEEVGEQIENLKGVDPKLKRALEKGAVRLDEVIAQCEEVEVEATPESAEPEEEAAEGEEEEREGADRRERAQREGRGEGGAGGGSGPEPGPERSERGEERSSGREGDEGGGERPSPGDGGEEPEDESQSGGVGPGTEVGGGE